MVTKEEKLCGGEKLLLNILMTGRRNGEMLRGIFKKTRKEKTPDVLVWEKMIIQIFEKTQDDKLLL